MKSASIGSCTSATEVTDISRFGIWILHRGIEYFLPFEDFPWFREAAVSQVLSVVEEGPEHLRWPELDIDLSLESIRNPKQFPLISEAPVTSGKRLRNSPPSQPGTPEGGSG